MPTPRKFEHLMSLAEQGMELNEEQMISASMSLLNSRRTRLRGGRPKKLRKCAGCGEKFGVVEMIEHRRVCGNNQD
jgi:hypothetical protein